MLRRHQPSREFRAKAGVPEGKPEEGRRPSPGRVDGGATLVTCPVAECALRPGPSCFTATGVLSGRLCPVSTGAGIANRASLRWGTPSQSPTSGCSQYTCRVAAVCSRRLHLRLLLGEQRTSEQLLLGSLPRSHTHRAPSRRRGRAQSVPSFEHQRWVRMPVVSTQSTQPSSAIGGADAPASNAATTNPVTIQPP